MALHHQKLLHLVLNYSPLRSSFDRAQGAGWHAGAFARDLWNKVQCEHNSAAQHLCGKKPILVAGESLLTSSDPMYQPKVIMRSMTRTFRDWKDIAQVRAPGSDQRCGKER